MLLCLMEKGRPDARDTSSEERIRCRRERGVRKFIFVIFVHTLRGGQICSGMTTPGCRERKRRGLNSKEIIKKDSREASGQHRREGGMTGSLVFCLWWPAAQIPGSQGEGDELRERERRLLTFRLPSRAQTQREKEGETTVQVEAERRN